MSGSRPLSDSEIEAVLGYLTCVRDKTMFVVGLRSGFRISEILSLTVANVTQYGKVANQITVNRKSMKGKHSSRTVPLHPQAKKALEDYIATMGSVRPETKLFDFKRQRGHSILKEAFNKAQLEGKVSTHSLRKSFASRVHKALGENIYKTQQALGHASLSSTAHYLSFDQSEINEAIVGV
jgi:integrase/recombinase XerD